MNRNKFLKLFKDSFIEVKIDDKKIDNNLYINLKILTHIEEELKLFNLNEIRFIGFKSKELNIDNNILKINLNEIYDYISKEHNITGLNRKLYRIESNDNLGIYNAGGAYLFKNKGLGDPYHDEKLNTIFDSMNDYNSTEKYKGDWNFAFDNLEDLKSWIGNKETYLNILNDKRGFNIKEIIVPDYMVINGDKQVIFKNDRIRTTNKIEFKTLEKYFLNNKLKKML